LCELADEDDFDDRNEPAAHRLEGERGEADVVAPLLLAELEERAT